MNDKKPHLSLPNAEDRHYTDSRPDPGMVGDGCGDENVATKIFKGCNKNSIMLHYS